MSVAAVEPAASAPEPVRTAASAASAPRSLSLRRRLVLLVLSVLTPALLVTGLLIWSIQREAYHSEERQLATTARTLALVVDGRIGEQVAVLRALSVSRLLAQGDWRGFDAQARLAVAGGDAWVVVRAADGRQLVNTFAPPGAAMIATPDSAVGATWSGRRDEARVSNLLWGPVARSPVVVVLRPVELDDGRTAELGVVMPAASFSKLLQRQGLAAGWTATILDGRKRVVGRNRGGARFVGHSATPTMQRALATAERGVVRSRTLDGIPTITAFDRLPGYGWTASVSMPRAEALGAVEKAILLGTIGGLLLLGLGVLMALRMGRRIARPVESLADAASRWVGGGDVSFAQQTGLPETDRLSRAFAAALQALDDRDERRQLLINELNHRVKNTLATVQAVAVHTRRGAGSVDDYHDALEGRVIAMSRAHELLTRSSWEGAELGELARETLRAFAGRRLRIEGPPTQVAPTEALNLALILYELATNAAKHGALSRPDGEVSLSWRREAGRTRVCWVESGGPAVAETRRQGFGSRLISRAADHLKPSMLSFRREGVRCELTLPPHR